MNHQDTGAALFLEGYNCAQAAFAALAEEFGFSREDALRAASALGGGIGGTGGCCGAAVGMLMAIGVAKGQAEYDPTKKAEQSARARKAMAAFAERCGGVTCPAIRGDRPHCAEIVRTAIAIAEEICR